MSCTHDFFIYGTINKPHVKYNYHNNFILKCSLCPKVQITVRNKKVNVMEFENLEELAEFCIRYRYGADIWPTV